MRRALALTAVVLLTGLLTTACGGDDETPRVHTDDDPVACEDTLRVQVVVNEGAVTPGDDVRAACVDQEIELIVSADSSGTIAVKDRRTQRFPYGLGQQSVHLVFHRTGRVAVTDTTLEQPVVSFEITTPVDGSPSPLPTSSPDTDPAS